MNICFFGSYDPNYSRNKILIDGLIKNKVKVYHCISKHGSFIKRYPDLVKKFYQHYKNIDVIYVAFVGHLNVPLAWVLGKLTHKKVFFDMFYSMYDTYVFDRQSVSAKSLRAKSYWIIDKLATTLSDVIISDTNAHADYWSQLLKVPRQKFKRVFVGGDETIFKPILEKSNHKIIIEFHGMITRLHGAEYFIDAAKLLIGKRNLEFLFIGETSSYNLPIDKLNKLKLKNVKHIKKLSLIDLAQVIAGTDISIGHLGTTIKAQSVITNKIFQAMACKLPVIVEDSPASKEIFTNGKNAMFVKMGDSIDLEKKIMILANDVVLRKKIAENGYKLFISQLTNEKLGKVLLEIIGNN
jgi:glycosyltransferase involved in cell wall biosynthesis